jgi:ribose transport system ATP-binding protein
VESRAAEPVCDRLELGRHSLGQPVVELSGGNQQKVVVARWLLAEAQVLLFDEPTRGIDVSARGTVHRIIEELAESGKAVVVASSELDELTEICDRIAVLAFGRLVRIFERGSWTREALTSACFGAAEAPA